MAKPGPRSAGSAGTEAASAVRSRLVEAAIVVLAREGFAHASARAIGTEAGCASGLIYYHFGSMDQLLAATARTLASRGLDRIKAGLGGDDSSRNWPSHLGDVLRAEAAGDDGQAVLELMVGARTSPLLAAELGVVIDEALGFITTELESVLADTPLAQLLPAQLIAELAGGAFLGLEVLIRNGRDVDIDLLASTIATGLTVLGASTAARPASR